MNKTKIGVVGLGPVVETSKRGLAASIKSIEVSLLGSVYKTSHTAKYKKYEQS